MKVAARQVDAATMRWRRALRGQLTLCHSPRAQRWTLHEHSASPPESSSFVLIKTAASFESYEWRRIKKLRAGGEHALHIDSSSARLLLRLLRGVRCFVLLWFVQIRQFIHSRLFLPLFINLQIRV